MTIDFDHHSSLERSCEIVDPAGYTLNRYNNEILVSFKQALGYLVETIDILREPISNLNEVQQTRIESIRKIFAYVIYKAKVQELKKENYHLSRDELKKVKGDLAKQLCNDFSITEENTCPCLNDRERLALITYSVNP